MRIKLKVSNLLRFKRNKLRVTTAPRRLRTAAATDYEETAEPNIKLSRALLIVLLLHVVAVAGIIAFNAIKTRQGSVAPASADLGSRVNSTLGSTIKSATSISPTPIAQKGNAKPVAKDGGKIDRTKNTPASTKMYVVAKGDNPVTIAKKFKVSYDELLALNHIDDPRKLQPGQKLLIPSKIPKGKKANE
jgi:LysM repeat protein